MIERVNIVSRESWLIDRLSYINASEAGVVCGEGDFGSLAQLFAEKKGLRPPMVDNDVLRRGRWAENATFQALSEERPEWEIKRASVHVRDQENRLAATPDGYALRPDRDGFGLIECKAVARSIFRRQWLDEPDSGDLFGPAMPPVGFLLQTLQGMMLDGLSWGTIAALITGEFAWHLRLFDVERDEVLEDRIRFNAAKFFADYLDPGIMPPFTPARDEVLVRALFPRDDGTEIDLSGDNRALVLVEDWQETAAALSRLKKQEKEIKVELTGKIGEHTYARLADGRRLSWRLQHRKAHSVAASDFRMLRLSEKSE